MYKLFVLIAVSIFFTGCNKDDSIKKLNIPESPENLAGVVDSSSIILTWSDRSNNEDGFKIERKSNGSEYSVVGVVKPNEITFVDSLIYEDTDFTYRIYSFNKDGKSTLYSNEITLRSLPLYSTVTIGNQTWTSTNLDVSTYSDGVIIPQVGNPQDFRNLETGAWCYYEKNTSYGKTYGKLYNWYAVKGIWNKESLTNEFIRKNLAPDGFHIPSTDEWSELIIYLGGVKVAGGKMKSTGTLLWEYPNQGATNESGFTGYPGGCFNPIYNTFETMQLNGYWWSDHEKTMFDNKAACYILDFLNSKIDIVEYETSYALSVRCIKD